MNNLARPTPAQVDDLEAVNRQLFGARARGEPASVHPSDPSSDVAAGASSPMEEVAGRLPAAYLEDRPHPPPVLPPALPRPTAFPLEMEDLPWDEVALGLRPSEVQRAGYDTAFAAEMKARHRRYAERVNQGDTPLGARDYEFWRWQRAVDRARSAKVGFLTKLAQLPEHIASGAAAMLDEGWEFGTEMLYLEMKSYLSPEDYIEAQRARADLGVVAVAKALAGNSALVRAGLDLNDRAATSLAKLFDSPERAEFYEELHDRYLYDSAQKNHDDDKTASSFHRDILALAPGLSLILGHTDVNQGAASFASNFVPIIPEAAVEQLGKRLVAATTRSMVRHEVVSVARGGTKPTLGVVAHPGEFRAAEEVLAAQHDKLARAQAKRDALAALRDPTVVDDIVRAGREVRELSSDVATREVAIATRRALAAEQLETLARSAQGHVAALRAAGPTGRAAEIVEGLGAKLAALPPSLAERVAPGSSLARGAASVTPGAIAAAEATVPTMRRLRQAEVASGFSGPAASLMVDPVTASLRHVRRAGVEAARTTMHSAVVGGFLGALTDSDDPLRGFGYGFGKNGTFGAGQSILNQSRVYASPAHVRLEQAGRRRSFREALEMRPEQVQFFDRLPEEIQTAVAHYSAANPRAKLKFIDDPHRMPGAVDSLDRNAVTINLAGGDPLVDIVRHEISHTTESDGVGALIDRQLLGDAAAGLPGDYTLRDSNGHPVRTADGLAYATNSEFARLRSTYIERFVADAKARGWSAEKIVAEVSRFDNRYIARELYAEQFAAYLTSSAYRYDLLGGPRAGYFTPSDLLLNSTTLQNTLGRIGFVFGNDGGIVHSPLFGDYHKSPALGRLAREYVRRQSDNRAGGISLISEATVSRPTPSREIVERYLADSPVLLRDTDGRPLYDTEGRARLRPTKDIKAEVAAAANALANHLDEVHAGRDSAVESPPHIDAVQRRETSDGERYTGRFLDEDSLDALVDSGHLSSAEFDQLERINTALRESEGRGVVLTRFELADPATPSAQRHTGVPGRWRSDIVTGFEVTRDGQIALQTLAPEAVRRSAADISLSDAGAAWYHDAGAVVRDVDIYAQNRLAGRTLETGLSGDVAAKVGVLERLFASPTEAGRTTLGDGRLDAVSVPLQKLNRALVVEAMGEIGTQYSPRLRLKYGSRERPFPEPGTSEYESFNFGDYLEYDLGIPRPLAMQRLHAHHILRKKGRNSVEQALVDEGQNILRRYGIDPVFGKENLTWAPQYAEGQHTKESLLYVVTVLKKVEGSGGDKAAIVKALKKLGKMAAERK